MKTTVKCSYCGAKIEVENWTYGAEYWCNNECLGKQAWVSQAAWPQATAKGPAPVAILDD